jgi:hypothetical protein
MRKAISPRLAIRILSNMSIYCVSRRPSLLDGWDDLANPEERGASRHAGSLDDH